METTRIASSTPSAKRAPARCIHHLPRTQRKPLWRLTPWILLKLYLSFGVGLEYELHIQYPKSYPWDPFRIKVCTPLYHVAIDKEGRWCSYLLTAGWVPRNITKEVSRKDNEVSPDNLYILGIGRVSAAHISTRPPKRRCVWRASRGVWGEYWSV